jgi:uncharacterized protein involved in exopolysaccharide biosynthesis
LLDYLRKKHIVDVDEEISIQSKEYVQQEKSVRLHHSKVRAAERKLEAVRAQLAHTPEQIPYAEEYHPNPVLQAFRSQLTELEAERMKLLEAYLPSDRHVRDKDEAIARFKARIKPEPEQTLGAQTVRYNDLHADLQRNALNLEVHLVELREAGPGIVKRLRSLRDDRFKINHLKQAADEKRYAYDLYRKKQEEARITEAMKDQSMVNVSVVERATPPLEPVNGLLLPLLLGLVGGLTLASAVAVGIEYLNRRLRFEEEVERYLELPVLAVIPDLETTSAIARA